VFSPLHSIPAELSSGRTAWDEFIRGVGSTFEANRAMSTVLGLVLIALVVVWIDYRIGKWIIRGRGGARGKGPRGTLRR